jgi:hypothetical protein
MVLIRPFRNAIGDVPFEYDVRNTCPYYNIGEDMLAALKDAEKPVYGEARKELIGNCFYFNDGHAIERACQHVKDKVKLLKDRLDGKEDKYLNWQLKMMDRVTLQRKALEEKFGGIPEHESNNN